jgi:putative lipoprotein
MSFLRAFAVSSLLGIFVSCGGSDEPRPTVSKETAAQDDAATAIPRRGIVKKTGDTFTLLECGAPSGRSVNVVDRWGELSKAFSSLDAPPATGIYVEMAGPASTDGGSLTLEKLVRARLIGGGHACEPPVFAGDYVLNGNEPFWAIEIREDGIVFKSPDQPKGITYPYAITRDETGTAVYATKIETPKVSTLEIVLEPARCVDSMSGEIRSFKAHVIRDKTALEGCAAAGVPPGAFGSAPLDELNRYAGTFPGSPGMWSLAPLGPRLAALLGAKEKSFLENAKVCTPVLKDGGVFYMIGNRSHQGLIDMAMFVADPSTDTINVVLFNRGVREDFKEEGRDVELPAEVRASIASVEKPE